jgi:hypothetical protein
LYKTITQKGESFMNKRYWPVFLVLITAMLAAVLSAPGGSVAASPAIQMTPESDPMAIPTVVPTVLPDGTTLYPGMGAGAMQMNCPMMSGSMTGMTGASGMPMNMGSGMMGTSGMQGMGQMGTMPMAGMQTVNDELSMAQQGWFATRNPWMLIGWVLLFGLVLALLFALVAGIVLLVRQLRRGTPPAA